MGLGKYKVAKHLSNRSTTTSASSIPEPGRSQSLPERSTRRSHTGAPRPLTGPLFAAAIHSEPAGLEMDTMSPHPEPPSQPEPSVPEGSVPTTPRSQPPDLEIGTGSEVGINPSKQ